MSKVTEAAPAIPDDVRHRYEAVIGLEVHLQLATATKVFCACSTRFGDPPNTNVCPVCLGLPGALPVLNRRAVELAIRASLALHCSVQEGSRFARKNYFYPDLPKGYQISMYELPLASAGWLEIERNAAPQRIGITRLHMEDDAAKNLHEGFPDSDRHSYIDFNRCGVPLVEIVSEPDLRSPAEAYAYLTTLKQILEYTEVSDCDMEKGSLRCDANVSIRPRGESKFGTKAEVKNLNSFRYLQRALEHEIERQIALVESGQKVVQETRLYNVAAGRTVPMRSKEFAHDYRYFPEPDLLPLRVNEAWRADVLNAMPELPDVKRARFLREHQLSAYDAGVLTATRALADYFEATVRAGAPPKAAANWIQTELLRRLNDTGTPIEQSPLAAAALAELLQLIESGKITAASGKRVFAKMFESGKPAAEIVAAEGLDSQLSEEQIQNATEEVFQKNSENVSKYRAGNEGVSKFLVGQVMRLTKGHADPRVVHNQIRLMHEKAVAESFLAAYPGSLRFGRFGHPPEPDVIVMDANGKMIGIEVTTTYLDKDEAKAMWSQATTGRPQIWSSGVIGGVDDEYSQILTGAILRKRGKKYSVEPTWLLVDFNYALGDREDVKQMAYAATNTIKQIEDLPFSKIWAVWQVTNVDSARYELFEIR